MLSQLKTTKVLALLTHLCEFGIKTEIWGDLTDEPDAGPSSNYHDLADAVAACDEEEWLLYTTLGNGERLQVGWIWIVWGNSPEEVFADYTVSLEPFLKAFESAFASEPTSTSKARGLLLRPFLERLCSEKAFAHCAQP